MSLLLGLGCTSTAGPVVLERLADAQRHPEAKAFVVRAERVEGVVGVARRALPKPPQWGLDNAPGQQVYRVVPLVDPGEKTASLWLGMSASRSSGTSEEAWLELVDHRLGSGAVELRRHPADCSRGDTLMCEALRDGAELGELPVNMPLMVLTEEGR